MRRIQKMVAKSSEQLKAMVSETKAARRLSRRAMQELFKDLSPLEERVLMTAITINSQADLAQYFTSSTNSYSIDAGKDSVTIASNIIINTSSSTGQAGSISISGQSVTIGANAQILANGATDAQDGSITIAASNVMEGFDINAVNQVEDIVRACQNQTATINLGADVLVEGGSVSLTTESGNKMKGEQWSSLFLPLVSAILLEYAQKPDAFSTFVTFQGWKPVSTIDLQDGAAVKGSESVSIDSSAEANALGKAVWNSLNYGSHNSFHSGVLSGNTTLTGNLPFGLAVGDFWTDANSTISIAPNALIQSDGSIGISSTVKNTIDLDVEAVKNTGITPTNPRSVAVAWGSTQLKTTSVIDIQANSTISAFGNVTISANATDKNEVKSKAASFMDGLVTLGGSYANTNAKVQVIVNGTVKSAAAASSPETSAPVIFNPAYTVKFSNSSLNFSSPVGYTTGQPLIFDTSDGSTIPGLVPGTTYYAIVNSAYPNQLQLAATVADAQAGTEISFGAGYPTLSVGNMAVPITLIDSVSTNTIQFGYSTAPDGLPLFQSGRTVTYTPMPGKFIGMSDSSGNLLGALPAGQYTVQELKSAESADFPLAIQLLDSSGNVIVLNTNSYFTVINGTGSGTIYQVSSIDTETSQIDFNFPAPQPDSGVTLLPTPVQNVKLTNGQQIQFTAGFNNTVANLVTGQTYYAVVNSSTTGVINVATTAAQAAAANPAVQDALAQLQSVENQAFINSVASNFATETNSSAPQQTSTLQFQSNNSYTLWNNATTGNFTLNVNTPYGVQTTPALAWNITASALQAALTALGGLVPTVTGSGTESSPWVISAIFQFNIGNFEPGTGLVFDSNPLLADGSPVIYQAVPGKPVPGLTNGATYYVYSQTNPYFSSSSPQYILSLHATADANAVAVDFSNTQTMTDSNGLTYDFASSDMTSNQITLNLPVAAPVTAVNGSQLTGGTAALQDLSSGAIQLISLATSGNFTLTVQVGSDSYTTASLPFNASAIQIQSALNAISGVTTSVFGLGTISNPWTIIGLDPGSITANSSQLLRGTNSTNLISESVSNISQILWTNATGGTFAVTLNVNGQSVSTAPLAYNATAAQLETALNAIGQVGALVSGSGTQNDPWLIVSVYQSIQTGDALTFNDAWGEYNMGLVNGQTYYAVVSTSQADPQMLVLSLAPSYAEAVTATATLVNMQDYLQLESVISGIMTGAPMAFSTEPQADSGVNITTSLVTDDSASFKSQVGGIPIKNLFAHGREPYQIHEKTYYIPRTVNTILANKLPASDYNNSLVNWFTTNNAAPYGLSAALAMVDSKNISQVIIGSTAVIQSSGSVNIDSSIEQVLHTFSGARISKNTRNDSLQTAEIGIALDLALINNTSRAVVESNAVINAGSSLNVNSDISYPFAWEQTNIAAFHNNTATKKGLQGTELGLNILKDVLFSNAFGVSNWLFNNTSNVVSGKLISDLDKNVFALTLNSTIVSIANTNLAQICDGAQINQGNSPSQSPSQSVNLTAHTTVDQISVAGQFGLSFNLSTLFLYSGIIPTSSNERLLFKANPAGDALGGAVDFASMVNSTQALIGGPNPDLGTDAIDNVAANATQPTRINFGNGGLGIDAQTEVTYVQICQSGGKSTNMGFAGSLAVINVGNPNNSNSTNKQVTNAAILSAALPPVIQANNGTNGDISITANDDTSLVSVTGGVTAGASKNLGLSGSLIFLTRNVTAAISPSNLSETAPPASIFNLAGNITIASSAGGSVVPVSIVGAYTSSSKGDGDGNGEGGDDQGSNNEEILDRTIVETEQDLNTIEDSSASSRTDLNSDDSNYQHGSNESFFERKRRQDLAFGSDNVNLIDILGDVNNVSFRASMPAGPNDGANNPLQGDNDNLGVDQAASQPGGTWGLGISGDFSGAWLKDSVTSIINDSGHFVSQPGHVITVSSLNETLVEGISGSAALISMGGNADATVAASGSVAIVNVTSNVTSQINHANINGFGLDVTAENKKVIGSFSGGMQVAVVPSTSVNVDGSISYNTITNNTVAQLNDVTGTDVGQVVVDATAADRDWASGGMLTVSWDRRDAQDADKPKTSVGIGVSGAMNTIVNNTFADVLGSSIDQTSGDFEVNATDLTHSFVFSSGLNMTVAAGTSVNIGGMFATANMTANTLAVVANSTISNNSTSSEAGFQANALFVPVAISIAGYISVEYGKVISEKADKIQVGVGAAVIVTNIQGSNYAGASNSTISMSGGDIQFVANSTQPSSDPAYQQFFDNTPSNNIYSLAIVGSAQGESSVGNAVGVPVGGAVIVTQTAIATQAQVDSNSTLTTPGNLTINALENLSVKTDAGGAIAGLQFADEASVDVAIGTAVNAYNSNNTIQASVENSCVTTGQSLTVSSKKTTTVDTIAFGVAVGVVAAGGLGVGVSLSGAFGFNTSTDTIASFISGGSVNVGAGSGGALNISAIDQTNLTLKAGAGSLSVAVGGETGVAIAPSTAVGINTVTNRVLAFTGSPDSTANSTSIQAFGPVNVTAEADQVLAAKVAAVAVTVAVGGSTGLGFGFSGSGAGAATNTTNNITAGLLYGTVLTSTANGPGGGIAITATDAGNVTSIVNNDALAVAIGGSLGVSIAEINNDDNTNALISGATVRTSGSDVSVNAYGQNLLSTESVATSLSAIAGAGGNSNVYDNSNVTASVGSGSSVVTGNTATGYGNLNVLANTSETVMAQIFGGSLGIGSVGVFMSNATRSGSTVANLVTTGNVSVGNLAVKATTNQTITSEGMSVTVGGLAGTGETHRLGINENVQTNVSGSDNPWNIHGNLSIGAKSTNNATAQTSGAGNGQQDVSIAGLGVGFFKVDSAVNPVVSTSISNVNLVVSGTSSMGALANSTNHATARSGSGSLVGGEAARAITDNSPSISFTTTNLTLSSASATFLAQNCGTYFTNANSVYATFLGGSAARAYNNSAPNLTLNLGTGTAITANVGSVIVKAENDVTGLGDAENINGKTSGIMARVGGGGIVGGFGGTSVSCLTANSAISLGDGISIRANGQGGKILIGSSQDWNTDQLTYMHDSSGIGGAGVHSSLTSCLTNNIALGSNVSLTAPSGSVGIGTSTISQTMADSYSYTFAIAGGSRSVADNTLSACETVTIGNNSLIRAAGDISVTAGHNPVNGISTTQETYAVVTAHCTGLASIPGTEACATANSNTNVLIGTGSQIISDRDVDLGTIQGINDAACYTFANIDGAKGKTNSATDGATQTSNVTINGNVIAGYSHQLDINIPQSGNAASVNGQTVDWTNTSGGLTNVIPQNSSAFLPFQAAYQTNYNATQLLNGLDETSKLILSKSISTTPVNAITLSNLAATGGQVVIHADTTLAGTGSISAFSPNITVTNNSPAYLLLDGIGIPNTLNMGKISVVGSASLPAGLTLNQQLAEPSISINQLYNHAVGNGTTAGPAIAILAPIVNTAGSVTIYNACGALVQDAPINTMSLSISTPNSAYIVNTPKSYMGTGGSISDYWTNSSMNVVQNSSFENPACGTGNFVYNPSGANWTFTGSAGVSGNDSGFTSGNPNAPAGNQVAFLQEKGVISQTISGLVAGQSYTISFNAAQRAGYPNQSFTVTLGSTSIANSLTPSSSSYQNYSYTYAPTISGNQTLTFTGLEPSGQDETVFLDQVIVTPTTTNITPGLNSYVYQYTANLAATTAANVLYLQQSGATNSTAFSNWLYNTGGVSITDFTNANITSSNIGTYPSQSHQTDNSSTTVNGTGIIFFGSEIPYIWATSPVSFTSGSTKYLTLSCQTGYLDNYLNAQVLSQAASGNPADSSLNVTQGTGPYYDGTIGGGIFPTVPSTFPTNLSLANPEDVTLGNGITAGQLDITALYIDINAPINLGVKNTGFQANLSASLGSYIQSQLADNLSVSCIPIPDSYLGGSNTSLSAYFDVLANQIVLNPVAINAGAVAAIFKGGIISTTDQGKITVSSNAGQNLIDNQTGYPLVIQGIEASQSQLSGIVQFNDTLTNLSTAYVYRANNVVEQYQGTLGPDHGANLSQLKLVSNTTGTSATFSPAANLAYQWEEQAFISRNLSFTNTNNSYDLYGSTYGNPVGTVNDSWSWGPLGTSGSAPANYTSATNPFKQGNALLLSNGTNNTANAYWYQTKVDIPTSGNFTVSFNYQASGNKAADGMTLAFQNQAANAIGNTGGALGYQGITGNTTAYQINLYNAGGSHIPGSNFVTTNTTGTYHSTGNVNYTSGDWISVQLVYDADTHTVTENLKDLSTSDTYQNIYSNVNLASVLGSQAYIGFTGGEGGATSIQVVTDFSLTTPSLTLKGFDEWASSAPGGVITLSTELSNYTQQVSAMITQSETAKTYFIDNTAYAWNYGPSTTWTWTYPTEILLQIKNQLPACNPISIDFSGVQCGTLIINSGSSLLLDGNIQFPGQVSLNSGGNITQASGAVIAASELTGLTATGAIGNTTSPLNINIPNGSTINAQAVSGLYLSSNQGLTIGAVAASNGPVVLQSNGSLIGAGASSNVSGTAVTLLAPNGSIGSQALPITIQTVTTMLPTGSIAGGLLTASATDAIYLTQPTGDLRIGSVKTSSPNGIVSITTENGNITDGNIPDAFGLNTGNLSTSMIEQTIKSISLHDQNSANLAISSFEGSVDASYLQYWTALDNGIVANGSLTLSANGVIYYQPNANSYYANTANQTSNATEEQVNSYANMLYDNAISVFENSMAYGPGWASQPEFQTYNASYSFTASNATISALTYQAADVSNTFALLSLDALSPQGSQLLGNTTAPAIQTSLLLLKSSGSIGLSLDPVEIQMAAIQNGTLTPREKALLALATNSGELQIMGNNVIVKIEKPLFVNVADNGQVQLSAGSSISLTETSGSLNIANISTPGNVRLVAGASINQVPASSQNTVVLNPTINNLVHDSDFETPALGTGNFSYGTPGSSWTFTGGAGISGNESGFTNSNPNAPVGSQVAFLQSTGAMSQTINGLVAGQQYTLSFYAAQRGWDFNPSITYQTFNVTLGNQSLAANVNPSSTSYQFFTYTFTCNTTGSQTLTFTGLDPTNQDETVFLDQVSITPVVAITANNLRLTSDDSIGSPTNPIAIQITGKLDSYSTSDLYLNQVSGDLLLGTIKSAGSTQINAQGNITGTDNTLKGAIGNFGTNGTGWTLNSQNQTAAISQDVLTLGNAGSTGESSAWFNQPTLVVNSFIVSFTYQSQFTGNGLTFTIQNDSRGTSAIGDSGPALGYGTNGINPQIQPSLAWQLNNGASPNATQGIGLNRNGGYGIYQQPGSINFNSNHPIQVVLQYSTTSYLLTQTLTDTVTGETYSSTLSSGINLFSLFGNAKAIFGFTGSGPAQAISNFYFSYGEPTISAGNLALSSGGQIGTSSSPMLMLATGSVNATAPNGIYLLQTDGDLYVNSISSQANVSLSAPTGAIVNSSSGSVQSSSLRSPSPAIHAAAVPVAGITAAQLHLSSLYGLGSANQPLITQVNELSAINQFGDIVVNNSGPLAIGDGSPGNAIQAGRSVNLTSDSAITVNSPVSAAQDIQLRSTPGYTGGSRINVNPGVTIASETGGVYLHGGDGVSLAPGSTVRSNATDSSSVVELNSNPIAGLNTTSPSLESRGRIVADNIRFNASDIGTNIYLALEGIRGLATVPTVEFNAGSGYDTLTVDNQLDKNGLAVSIANGLIQAGDQKLILNAIDSVILELGDGNDQVKVGSNMPLDQLQIFTHGGDDSIETTLSSATVNHQSIDGGLGTDSIKIDGSGQKTWASTGLVQSWNKTIAHTSVESISLQSATTLNAMPVPSNTIAQQIPSGLDSNRQFIESAYQQVLNRLATPSELNRWGSMLDRNTITRLQLANKLTNTDEARLLRINAWFLNYMGRPATIQESNQALRRIHSGQPETRVLAGILSGQEFFNRTQSLVSTGFSRDRFITGLYKLAIDPSSTPTPALQRFLSQAYQQKGRTAVILNVLKSAPVARNQAEGLSILLDQKPALQQDIQVRLGQSRPTGLQAMLLSRRTF